MAGSLKSIIVWVSTSCKSANATNQSFAHLFVWFSSQMTVKHSAEYHWNWSSLVNKKWVTSVSKGSRAFKDFVIFNVFTQITSLNVSESHYHLVRSLTLVYLNFEGWEFHLSYNSSTINRRAYSEAFPSLAEEDKSIFFAGKKALLPRKTKNFKLWLITLNLKFFFFLMYKLLQQ